MERHDQEVGSSAAAMMEERIGALLQHRDQIEEALFHGGNTRTFSGLVSEVYRGDAQVFFNEGAVIVSQLEDTEVGHRAVHLWLCAGELESVMPLTDEALDWGKDMGATVATSIGRRGWERLPAVKERGWKPDLTFYVKEL